MQFLGLSFDELLNQIVDFLPRLGLGVGVFLIALWLSSCIARWVGRTMAKRKMDPEMIVLLQLLVRWGLRIIGMVIALEMIAPGRFSSLVAGLGIAGFTIGFALQDVAKNFVSGIILLLQQPFDIGDSIEVSEYGGTVLAISLRTTEIKTWDGKHVLIPNGDVLTSPIVNYSKASRRRIEITAGIASDSDLDRVTRVAIDAVRDIPGLLEEPSPQVVYTNFGDFAIEFTLYFWIDTSEIGFLDAQNMGFMRLKRDFQREGIEMPFPTRTVLLQQDS
jgi:small conductance mechanosensitive channel